MSVARPSPSQRPYTLQPAQIRAQVREERTSGVSTLPAENRPQTRGECVHGPRPCPWLGCRYHLWLDVHPDCGSIKVNNPAALAWLEGPDSAPPPSCESCALDVADDGRRRGLGSTLREIGEILLIKRERVRQIEAALLRELQIVQWEPR